MANFILENNYFEFEDNICRQILGTAIGTKFAPSFANMFMGKLESETVERISPGTLHVGMLVISG